MLTRARWLLRLRCRRVMFRRNEHERTYRAAYCRRLRLHRGPHRW